MESLWSDSEQSFNGFWERGEDPCCGIFRRDPRSCRFYLSRPHAPLAAFDGVRDPGARVAFPAPPLKFKVGVLSKSMQPEGYMENQAFSASPPPHPFPLYMRDEPSISNFS